MKRLDSRQSAIVSRAKSPLSLPFNAPNMQATKPQQVKRYEFIMNDCVRHETEKTVDNKLLKFLFLFSDRKGVFHHEGICKSFLEIMEGYMTTREQHLTVINENKPGFSSAAPVFDPKQFKANKEV